MFIDFFDHTINIFERVYVRKAQHSQSKHLKIPIPRTLFFHPIILIMLPAIYFHDEFSLRAVKVHNVMADVFLPVES